MANLSNINNKFLVTTGGNVGIGDTGPSTRLTVDVPAILNNTVNIFQLGDDTNGLVFKKFWDSGGIAWRLNKGISGINMMTFSQDGKVGIGTASPGTKLDIGGMADPTVRIKSDAGGDPELRFDAAAANRSARIKFYDNGSAVGGFIDYLHNGDKMNFGAGSSTGVTMTVADGTVGIGTTTPQKKLHIEGTGGASEMQILVSSASDTVGHTAGIGLRGEGGEADGDFRIKGGIFFERIAGSFGNGKMILAVNSSVSNTSVTVADHALTIDTNKNVGIGDTSPQGKLEVSQNMSNGAASAFTSPHLRLSALNTTDSTGFVGMTFATSTADNYGFSWGALRTVSALGGMHLRYHGNSASGTDIFNIDYVGNVTIPSTRFIRSDSSAGYLIIQGGATYPGGRIEMYGGSNAAAGIIFSTGTTTTSPAEKMRITSGGNVAIGITFATAKLQIHNTNGGAAAVAAYLVNASTSLNTETRLAFAAHTNDDIATNRYSYISTINTSGSNGQDMIFATNATGASAVERIRITSDGRVGIGTTPETGTLLHLEKNSAANTVTELLRLDCGENSHAAGKGGAIVFRDINVYSDTAKIIAQRISASSASTLQFQLRGSEKMRITSEGDVLFGTTSTPNGTSVYGSAFTDETSNRMILRMASATTGAVNLVQFYNGNGLVGKIQTSGSATSYITSSDYRLKENVVEMTGALDRVSQLKPSRFNFISDADTTVDGFLAHEVQEIVPEAISGEKDAVDEEGNPKYQGIDQSKLVPLLVGAIQELKAEIETLKLQINN